LELTNSILKDIRVAVGLAVDVTDFDGELLPHINNAISELNQIGVGNPLVVVDDKQLWGDLQNPNQTDGNLAFQMVPQFIGLSTKMLFDPPPPSTVQFYASNVEKLLWRLKFAYEEPYTTTTTTLY
jgi:hypothetical protein